MTTTARQVTHEPDDRTARLLVAAVVDGGDYRATSLVLEQGPQACWQAIRDGALGQAHVARAIHLDQRVLEETMRRSRVRFIVPDDAEWPPALADLALTEPVRDGRGGVPIGLWLRGPGRLRDLTHDSVAVVGARACTPYGARVGYDLSGDLAEAGATVLSGMALGIDASAHRGALGVGGHTIAVLASGVDVPYPRANVRIYDQIAAEHLVVSEVRPGATPTRVGFLARNRLIAALARGTVLVEAALRSGARNTLNWAAACGRPTMAVPGSVESALSQGPHTVIRDGQATLVTSAAEVHELIAPMGAGLLAEQRGERRILDDLDPATLAVFEALPGRGRRTVGEVAVVGGVAIPACLAALGRLEELGLAQADAAGWRLVRH